MIPTALRRTVAQYPRQFWLVVMASFIDRLGGALLFPFFSLYLTAKFDITLTHAGMILAIFGTMGFIGGMIGGALTDRLGRKAIIIVGLLATASGNLLIGYADTLAMMYVLAFAVGMFDEFGLPAHRAMVAEMLPPEQHTDGYGILRIAVNLAMTIGPIVGGFLANRSYLLLFWGDAITSYITVIVVLVWVRETYFPVQAANDDASSDTSPPQADGIGQTLRDYALIFRDRLFMLYVMASIFANFVYTQMYATLPVFMRDERGIPPQGYGYVLSMNALMVVLMQYSIAQRVKQFAPMRVLAFAVVLYAVGYGLFGVTVSFAMIAVGMVFITLGEMVFMPVSSAYVAGVAPPDMRGRYMAFASISYTVPGAFGTAVAGVMIAGIGANAFWLTMGGLGLLSAMSYLWIHTQHPTPVLNISES